MTIPDKVLALLAEIAEDDGPRGKRAKQLLDDAMPDTDTLADYGRIEWWRVWTSNQTIGRPVIARTAADELPVVIAGKAIPWPHVDGDDPRSIYDTVPTLDEPNDPAPLIEVAADEVDTLLATGTTQAATVEPDMTGEVPDLDEQPTRNATRTRGQ